MKLFTPHTNTTFKTVALSIFLLGSSIAVSAQSDEDNIWDLRECIEYALENNIQIQQSELDLQAAEIDKSDALGNYLPTLSAQVSNSWNSGLTQDVTTGILREQTTRNLSLGATATITIFNGLRNLKTWQRAKLSKLASLYSLEEMQDNIMLNITNAYLNVLVNKERLRVLQQQNALTQEQLERTRILINTGSAPAGDSLEIKATDASEKQQIIVAKNDIRINLIHLAQLMQIDDYKNFDIAEATFDVPVSSILMHTPEEIITAAKGNRYEIKVAEQNVELAQKDVELAKSAYYPTLSGFFNFNTRESGANRSIQDGIDPNNPTSVIGQVQATGQDVVTPNFILREIGPRPFWDQLERNKGYSFGLRLSIPILNGFATRNNVKRSKIEVLRQENSLKQAQLDLESNIYQAYVDAQGAAQAFNAAQVAVNAKNLAFEYSQDRFDAGKITAFEFSQAKFDLTDAQSQLVNAKFDYIFKLKVLELYFGVEPEDMGL